jgi:glycosyltransferase involved in cell wall biosynthesis
MAVRDGEAEVRASAESVLAQEGVELELIVVDDGSTDATPEVLAALARTDPRLRPLRQEAAGLTAALIRGCSAARAPVIARQDAGDRSLPGRLAAQLAALASHAEVVLAACATRCEAPRGEELYVRRSDGAGAAVALGDPGRGPGPTAHGAAAFRRAAYERAGGYRPAFRLAQDWDLWLRLGEAGLYFEVAEELYVQRLRPDSISFRLLDLQRRWGRLAWRAAEARRAGRGEAPILAEAERLGAELAARGGTPSRRARALASYHFGEALRRRGDARAAGYLREAVSADPWLLRAWLRLAQGRARGAGPVA